MSLTSPKSQTLITSGTVPRRRRPRSDFAPRPRPTAEVNVTARSGVAGRGLGHERDRALLLGGDLLGGVLAQDVAVRRLHRFGVKLVDLVLAAAPLALGALDRDTGLRQLVAQPGQHVLVARGLEHVIVDEISRARQKIAISAVVRRPVPIGRTSWKNAVWLRGARSAWNAGGVEGRVCRSGRCVGIYRRYTGMRTPNARELGARLGARASVRIFVCQPWRFLLTP